MLLHLNDNYVPELIKAKKRILNAQTEKKRAQALEHYMSLSQEIEQYKDGAIPIFNNVDHLDTIYKQGDFVTAFFLQTEKRTYFARRVWRISG